MKVIVFSHAHPEFSKGGGEFAAHYLWQGINETPDSESWFVGCAPPNCAHKFTALGKIAHNDYILNSQANIPELTSTIDLSDDGDLAEFIRKIDPDIVHFHHYVNLGVELIRLVKNVCSNAKVALTLHEYIAICANNGQMIKTSGALCMKSSPRECNRCFPETSQEDFFLRERYIKSYFELVDIFISPSEFLKQRYVAWGVESDKIKVIENGLPHEQPLKPRSLHRGEERSKFVYFGQINPYKGIDVLLEALDKIEKDAKKRITLDIYGSGLESQSQEYQDKINNLLKKLGKIVRLHGPYEPSEMRSIAQNYDWIVMGSVWWENSPLVIQEAFKFKKPIITPDIGGMSEKVKPGKGGLNYRVRDSISLANTLADIVYGRVNYEEILQDMPEYMSMTQCTKLHLEQYRKLAS